MVVAYRYQSFFNAGRGRTNPQYLNYFTTLLLLTLLYKGRLLASRQVLVSECSVEWKKVGHRYEFAQRDCLLRAYTAREDDILPYNSWANVFTKLQFAAMLSQTDMHISKYVNGVKDCCAM